MTPAPFAQCREPVSDADIRALIDAGCNPKELSEWTGHEPQHAMHLAYGPTWWAHLKSRKKASRHD